MSKRVAAIVVVLATMAVASSCEAAEEQPFWFPGRRPGPGTVRPRNPAARPVTRTPPPPTTPGESPGRPEVPPSFGSPGTPSSSSSSPADCVTPLAALMTCGTFLTGSAPETPTPDSECCSGLSAFLNTSSAAGDGGDRTLRCLCPVILGDVNRMLPKPVDPVRMLYLPIACGVVLPPQVLYICFSKLSLSLFLHGSISK
jgi:hypothetical protein